MSTYPAIAIDRDSAIEVIHGLQVDLALLAAWLAAEPAMRQEALLTLESARYYLNRYAPCVRRH